VDAEGQAVPDELQLTGERTLPGIPGENYWFQRHVVAYRFAAGLVSGGEVLDAGCGEGYGASMLAERATKVVGVDLEPDVVEHAQAAYPSVRFQTGDLLSLPFDDASFDGVVTLQVIEHLQRPREFVSECARVLRPGGVLVLATPNRITFSPQGRIRNPFHTVEFSATELRSVLDPKVTVERMAGTFHGPRIAVIERLIRSSFAERQIAQPVPEWPGWLRRAVERIGPEDFRIRDAKIDRSLDLIAVAHR
jgi:SAM-dependent methyltransferase